MIVNYSLGQTMRFYVNVIASLFCIYSFQYAASSDASDNVSAILTADNHYSLYIGEVDGGGLTFIGRNEQSPNGNPGNSNWSLPETWNFVMGPGQYIYTMVWGDGPWYAWLGEFVSSRSTVTTNTIDWQYSLMPVHWNPKDIPGDGDIKPGLDELSFFISNTTWNRPGGHTINGSGSWANYSGGPIDGISESTEWIWVDDENTAYPPNNYLHIYRSAKPIIAAIPEPNTYTLILAGLGLVYWSTKKQF